MTNSQELIHCDGAIRIYDEDDYEKRASMPLQSRDIGKEGVRRKIFRVDGSMGSKDLVELCSTFFYWNIDVTAYLGCELSKRIIFSSSWSRLS